MSRLRREIEALERASLAGKRAAWAAAGEAKEASSEAATPAARARARTVWTALAARARAEATRPSRTARNPDLSPEDAAYVAGPKLAFDSACHPAAERYIRKIRNAAKREYAWSYWRWMNRLGVGPEPDHPGLSFMGAQAVRMSLHNICGVRWD